MTEVDVRRGRGLKRVITVVVAVLSLGVGAGYTASHFSDVPAGHPNRADIETVAGWGGYSGYPDGTFRPDRRISAEQMVAVIGRVFPDGMSRAEFASFLVGGRTRREAVKVQHQPTTNSNTDAPRWAAGCADYYNKQVERYPELGRYSSKKDQEARPPEDWTYRTPRESWLTRWSLEDTGEMMIRRVSEWYERIETETLWMCQGRAKLSNGRSLPIVVYRWNDNDGDSWFNWRFPAGEYDDGGGMRAYRFRGFGRRGGWPPLCNDKHTIGGDHGDGFVYGNGWDVFEYNTKFLYLPERDTDNDGIMCEDTLRENELMVLGENRLR